VLPQIQHAQRLRPEQKDEIEQAQRFRDAAANLRVQVSQGSYGDSELQQFWKLAGAAGVVLRVSNPELGNRAGLGDKFFLSVVRERRRPKLTSFLKALTAIVEVANERLFDIESSGTSSMGAALSRGASGVELNYAELLVLAKALGQAARDEIGRLEAICPNDLDGMAQNKSQRDFLQLFANGFDRIARALEAFAKNRNELLLDKARKVVNAVGNEINDWWKLHSSEAVDWAMRIPVLAAGVATLNLAGANMAVGTTVVATIVGGQKVVDVLRRGKSATRKHD